MKITNKDNMTIVIACSVLYFVLLQATSQAGNLLACWLSFLVAAVMMPVYRTGQNLPLNFFSKQIDISDQL